MLDVGRRNRGPLRTRYGAMQRHMKGSMMRILALALLTPTILLGCAPFTTSTAVDRLKAPAAAHAQALAGEDMAVARQTGRALLAQLAAYAGW